MVSSERSCRNSNGSRKLTSHLFPVVNFALIAGQDHRRSTYRQGPSGCRVAAAHRADLPKQGQVRIGWRTRSGTRRSSRDHSFKTCGGLLSTIDDTLRSLDRVWIPVSSQSFFGQNQLRWVDSVWKYRLGSITCLIVWDLSICRYVGSEKLRYDKLYKCARLQRAASSFYSILHMYSGFTARIAVWS
jgi:hypothetical protein